MPASYALEALKAQAVCARTYAVWQMQEYAYPEYEAHVDDSTSYQVYHKIDSQNSTDQAVEETAESFRDLAQSKGHELSLSIAPGLIYTGDEYALRQLVSILLDNAIKYSAPGGRITVKLWAGEYKAFVEILDQGRGIPPEDLENVKTKFYKGSNAVRGSGIGLALVDSIMTALDGTMDIQSTLGRGTVVTLGLPLYHKA